MNQIQIPKKWKSWYLNEIRLDKSQTIIPNKTKDQKFELYSVPAYNTGKPEIISGRDIGSNKQTVEEETVLLCKINPQINRVWIVSNHSSFPKIASTEWISFFKQDFINPKYLFYFLQNANFRKFLCQNVSGIGGSLTRIRPSVLNHYIIPVPTLEIQKKIVQKLDYILGQLEERKKEILQLINKFESKEILKSYQNRLLNLAFSGKLTEEELIFSEEYQIQIPKGWELKKISEITDSYAGGTPDTSITKYWENGTIPWIRSGELKDRVIDKVNTFISKEGLENSSAKLYPMGAVLVAITGATTGRTALLKISACGTQNVFGILPCDEVISEYVWYYMRFYYRRLVSKSIGGAQPHVNGTIIKNTEILYPKNKETQKKIIQKLDEKFNEMKKYEQQITSIEAKLQHTKKSLDLLTSSVLNSAFSGKLN